MFMSRDRGGSGRSHLLDNTSPGLGIGTGEDQPTRNPDHPAVPEAQPAEESKCGRCFFSEKGGVVWTLAVIIGTGILVIVLDLTLLEFGREQERESHKNTFTSNGSFVMHGTPEEYARFEGLTHHPSSHLTVLDLNYVEASITDLIRSMRRLREIREVRLRNLRLTGKFPKSELRFYTNTEYYFIKHELKEFRIEFNQSVGPLAPLQLDECDTCLLHSLDPDDLSHFRNDTCLTASLLMLPSQLVGDGMGRSSRRPANNLSLMIDDLSSNLNVRIKAFGWTVLDLNFTESRITSMAQSSDEILKALLRRSYVPKRVNLRKCEIELETLLRLAPTVTHLFLDTVNITLSGTRLQNFPQATLSQFRNLEELTIKSGDHNRFSFADGQGLQLVNFVRDHRDSSSEPGRLTLDLSDLPPSLRVLRLSNVLLKRPLLPSPQPPVRLRLKLLVLHGIIFEDQPTLDMILDPNYFAYEEVAWQNLNSDIFGSIQGAEARAFPILNWYSFLERKMRTNESTDWIYLDNLFSLKRSGPADQTAREKMIQTLEQLGISVSAQGLLLEREGRAEIQLGSQASSTTRGQWGGRSIQNSESDEDAELWFKALNMEVFLDKDWSTRSKW